MHTLPNMSIYPDRHTPALLGLQMSRKSCFWDLFSRTRTVLPTQGGSRDVQVTPLLSFCFSFVVHSGLQTFFPTKDPHPCCWARRWADPGADRDPSGHLSARLARPALAHVHPTPNLDMTSFPLCTCHFKSPGPGGPVPRVGLGEAGQLRVGGSFVSSQGPPGVRARLGKLQQRPTMASFPPRAASEQGLAGRPLGAPVISCAGCGAPGQPQWAGSGAGHLLPTRWAGSLRPEELLLLAGLARPACPAILCSGLLGGQPRSCLPRLPRTGNPSPSLLPCPCCRPHVLHHLPPSLCGRSAGPTELRMGAAGNTGLVNAEFIWGCVRRKLRFSVSVKVK